MSQLPVVDSSSRMFRLAVITASHRLSEPGMGTEPHSSVSRTSIALGASSAGAISQRPGPCFSQSSSRLDAGKASRVAPMVFGTGSTPFY